MLTPPSWMAQSEVCMTLEIYLDGYLRSIPLNFGCFFAVLAASELSGVGGVGKCRFGEPVKALC